MVTFDDPSGTERKLRAFAEAANEKFSDAIESAQNMGRAAIGARELLDDEQWAEWLTSSSISEAAINASMRIAREWGRIDKETLSDLLMLIAVEGMTNG